jgi:hypothetical protein
MLRTRRPRIGVFLCAIRGLALGAVLVAPPQAVSAQSEPQPAPSSAPVNEAAPCAFCRAPDSGQDFCPRCGRLSRLASTSSEHRFWADAPYVLGFPPFDSAPEIQSEFSALGLVHESVRFASGDRYDLKMERKVSVVHGRVGWMRGGKETDYSAEMEDVLDASQRLASRQVVGRLQGDPDMYLYRKLDYRYTPDGHLDRIEFKTWFYRGSSDWKKSPAAWLRHNSGEIVLRHDANGAVTRIETTLRDGKRSLRGEPEYGGPRVLVELVIRGGDRVDRVTRSRQEETANE